MPKRTGLIGEFREFIARGNVIDMAVGVIVGGAFKAIADSLTGDILMPMISMLIGGIDFSDWKIILRQAVVENGEEVAAAVTVNYGNFLSTILSFLIVAFAVFCMIKTINRFHRKQEAAPAPPPAPSREETLLTEIRDLLKERDR